jgi:periplasmic protein TonB
MFNSFMESGNLLHLINKSQTMTSKEILKASLLEIVFENRNKQYGAYALRKFYSNRLAIALASTMGFVLLACLIIRPSNYRNVMGVLNPHDTVVITTFVDPTPHPLLPPAMPNTSAPHAKSIDIAPPEIVADKDFTNPLPTFNELTNGGMPNTGGVDGGTGDPGPVAPVVTNVGNNSLPAVENADFHSVEIEPQFPGGKDAWSAFLSKYLQIPGDLQPGERKTVIVRFQVSEEGIVTNFEVVQSAGKSFDNEVMRVLKRMPKWKPAIQNNHKVATSFTQPVTFASFEN